MWVLTHTQPKSSRADIRAARPTLPVHTEDASAYSTPVGEPDRLVLVAELLRGDHRAEDLGLHQLVVLLQVRDQGGLVEVALGALLPPAGEDPAVVRRALDQPLDVGELVRVVDRSVQDVLVVRVVARPGALHRVGQGCQELVIDAALRHHAGGGGAVLTRVEVAGGSDALDRQLDVDVIEDHHRRLAAELEVGPLQVLRGRRRHRDAGAGGARDRHQLRDRVRGQSRAGVAVTADEVADARRDRCPASSRPSSTTTPVSCPTA